MLVGRILQLGVGRVERRVMAQAMNQLSQHCLLRRRDPCKITVRVD